MFHTEEIGDVVVWTIDRPQQRNALDLATMTALAGAVRAAASSQARAAILTATGDIFVAGGDLKELSGHTAADAERLTDVGAALTSALVALPFPVIAALNGPVIGGGAEIAIACDLRIGHPRARLSFKQVRMGVTTSWGSVPRLTGIVGTGSAARLLYAAHDLAAHECLRIGLYDAVDDDPRALALSWAADIAAGAPSAIAAMKELVQTAGDTRALERERFVSRWSSGDHEEAVTAFFGKRPAVFGPR